jgi:sugar phosphate isomerase/epimerase
MKLGCSTILYGVHSVDDALKGIKKAGFEGIELCAIPGMGFHIEPNKTEAEYRELKKKIDGYGLIVESIGGSGNDPYDASPDSNFRSLMRAAAIVGAPAITTGSGGKSDDAEDMKRAAEVFNKLAEFGKSVGTKVSIKPHVGGAVYHTPSSLEFMKLVDANWIGLNVDSSHLWRAAKWEAGEDSIPKLAKYIFTGRIRDTLTHDQPIGPVDTQIPGGGAMNLKAIMDAFKKVPGLGMVTVEIVGTAQWELAKIQDAVERTHAVLKGLV